jgi:hypothetical protein
LIAGSVKTLSATKPIWRKLSRYGSAIKITLTTCRVG